MNELITIMISFSVIFAGFLGIGYTVSKFFGFNKEKITTILSLLGNTDHIPCQSIPTEKADRAVLFVRVTGMLFVMRISHQVMFLSKKGYIKELIKSLLWNIFLGWWGIKSFICNIGALGNNIMTLVNYYKLDDLKIEAKTMAATRKSSPNLDASDLTPEKKPSKAFAIVSVIFSFAVPYIGIILSSIAFYKAKKNPEKYGGKTIALIGIIAASAMLVFAFGLPLLFALR